MKQFLSYKDLEVWQRATALVKRVYFLTKDFPREEIYSLTNQIRRAAASIPSNIAEGRSKRSTQEYIRFVNIACGSSAELETQIIISKELGYLSHAEAETVLNELVET